MQLQNLTHLFYKAKHSCLIRDVRLLRDDDYRRRLLLRIAASVWFVKSRQFLSTKFSVTHKVRAKSLDFLLVRLFLWTLSATFFLFLRHIPVPSKSILITINPIMIVLVVFSRSNTKRSVSTFLVSKNTQSLANLGATSGLSVSRTIIPSAEFGFIFTAVFINTVAQRRGEGS